MQRFYGGISWCSICELSASCSTAASEQQAATPGVTVFEGARLITGDGTPPVERATLVIDGARIVAVGPAGAVTVPAKATRVNLSGKTVMPAIVDTHVHTSQTLDALTMDLRKRAFWGVAAVMSLGWDVSDVPFQVRAQPIPGAALLRTAGRGITAPEPGGNKAPYWITTEAEGRKAVQEQAARHVDIVKIWVDDRSDRRVPFQKLSAPLYRAVIDEAHKNGLRVYAHVFNLDDAKDLLRAGADAFSHSIRDKDIDDEGLALFKAHPDFVLGANLRSQGLALDLSWLRGSMSDAALQKLQSAEKDNPQFKEMFAIQSRNLKKLNAAGVRIALGTDGNLPWDAHVEMADMVAAGLTPAQAIVASTRTSAEFMKLADMGRIAVGKSADFIVLDANPLDDITNTRRISSVYLRGVAVDRAAIQRAASTQ
jgi:imidazolonepropionase-like amidohydrolase